LFCKAKRLDNFSGVFSRPHVKGITRFKNFINISKLLKIKWAIFRVAGMGVAKFDERKALPKRIN